VGKLNYTKNYNGASAKERCIEVVYPNPCSESVSPEPTSLGSPEYKGGAVDVAEFAAPSTDEPPPCARRTEGSSVGRLDGRVVSQGD